MRKLILSCLLGILLSFSFSPVFAECRYNDGDSVSSALKDCAPQGSIVSDDYSIEKGVKGKVVSVTNQLILLGSILSVGGIVFAAFLYTSAMGDAEGVKKAKTALKFAIIGFIVMLLSFPIVNAIVNLIYGVGR